MKKDYLPQVEPGTGIPGTDPATQTGEVDVRQGVPIQINDRNSALGHTNAQRNRIALEVVAIFVVEINAQIS